MKPRKQDVPKQAEGKGPAFVGPVIQQWYVFGRWLKSFLVPVDKKGQPLKEVTPQPDYFRIAEREIEEREEQQGPPGPRCDRPHKWGKL